MRSIYLNWETRFVWERLRSTWHRRYSRLRRTSMKRMKYFTCSFLIIPTKSEYRIKEGSRRWTLRTGGWNCGKGVRSPCWVEGVGTPMYRCYGDGCNCRWRRLKGLGYLTVSKRRVRVTSSRPGSGKNMSTPLILGLSRLLKGQPPFRPLSRGKRTKNFDREGKLRKEKGRLQTPYTQHIRVRPYL